MVMVMAGNNHPTKQKVNLNDDAQAIHNSAGVYGWGLLLLIRRGLVNGVCANKMGWWR